MTDMSFLPEDYLERRVQRRTNLISLTLFVVVMGAVVAAFFVTDQQRSEVRSMQRQMDAQFEEAAKRLEQLDQLQQRKKEMIRKAKVTSTLLEKVPRSLLLAELINNMPNTLSLIEFEMQTKVVTARGPQPRTALDAAKKSLAEQNKALEPPPVDVEISLTGVAATDVQVAQFMTSLGVSNLFHDVNLLYSEEIKVEDQTLRKFRIELKLNENVDLRDYQPTLVKRDLKQNPMSNQIGFDAQGRLVPSEGGKPGDVISASDSTPKD